MAALGLTPGSYTWSWGAFPNQSFTVEIVGTTTTPVPAAAASVRWDFSAGVGSGKDPSAVAV